MKLSPEKVLSISAPDMGDSHYWLIGRLVSGRGDLLSQFPAAAAACVAAADCKTDGARLFTVTFIDWR